jgi:hypothetical protein
VVVLAPSQRRCALKIDAAARLSQLGAKLASGTRRTYGGATLGRLVEICFKHARI